jgi:hypothetical protein
MKYFQSFLVDRYLKTASLSSFENSFVLSCLGLLGKGSISDLRKQEKRRLAYYTLAPSISFDNRSVFMYFIHQLHQELKKL